MQLLSNTRLFCLLIGNLMHYKNSCEKNKKYLSKAEKLFLDSPFIRQCSLAGVFHLDMSPADCLTNLCTVLNVSPRTGQRWLDGKTAPHPTALSLLFNLYMGFPQHGKWQGWQLSNDYLQSPSGETITPDMIGRLWLWRNEKRSLLHKVNALTLENKRLVSLGNDKTRQIITDAVGLLNQLTDDEAILKAG